MRTHTIVKVEDGRLLVVAARCDRKRVEIVRSVRMSLPEVTRDSLAAVLRNLDGALFQSSKGVHVVLGERRMQHFVSTLPKLSANEAKDFVVREALRLTGMPLAEQVLASPNFLRKAPGGRAVVATAAIAKNVWEPIHEAFRLAGIQVLGLYASETCLAMAAKSAPGEVVAVLEISAGRARFVLCDGNAPVRVRRFLVSGGSDQSAEGLATQLAMELPRTLDWLRESGHETPQRLVIGTRIDIEPATLDLLREHVPTVEIAPLCCEIPEGEAVPSLSVVTLLRSLGREEPPRSLLVPPRLELPWMPSQLAALTAVSIAGFSFSFLATREIAAIQGMTAAIEQMDEESADAGRRLAELDPDAEAIEPPAPESTERLRLALSMRRPVSRLVAEVSNAAAESIKLEELRFASTERTVVAGVVDCRSRKDALNALAAFTDAMRQLPYAELAGQEEVGEVAGQPGRLRFRINLAWRNS